jgi:iron complex transport system ATP-binding protein
VSAPLATPDARALDGPVLATRGLAVGYRERRTPATEVLAGLDLALPRGELTCLLGPNGSGKSTLLRTLVGMQAPLSGEVSLDGGPLGALDALERARRLAVVLTDRIDSGMMTGADLVALGRYPYTGWSGRLDRRDHAVVRWAMDALAATPFADRRVAELSDGERQRVVIARALAQEPAVLALDEPTAYVDVPRRVELTQTLRHLARECELAVLLTTHDLDLAVRVADRLWLIEPRATGPSVVHVGAPEDLVLSGALARAFRADDVHFDLARGTFVPDGHGVVSVRVVGRGVAATWAGRALEREGFALVGDQAAADAVVTVLDGPVWRLEVAGRADEHLTLGSLVRTARGLVAEAARDRG